MSTESAVAEKYHSEKLDGRAQFRRTEKNNEEMALKIWAERRQPFSFIYASSSGPHYYDEPETDLFE